MSALAEHLHKVSSDFMNDLPWIKELTPDQRAVHRIHSQINVDCHNEYLSNILIKLAKSTRYKHAHRSYFAVANDLYSEEVRPKDIPSGVILRRLTNVAIGNERSKGFGRDFNEATGTLYAKFPDRDKLLSTCKVKNKEEAFYHPFYWEVPTVEEIDKVLSFSTQHAVEELNKILNQPVRTAIKEKLPCKKVPEKVDPNKKTFNSWAIQAQEARIQGHNTMFTASDESQYIGSTF